jgi:hypothetical protein
MPELGRRTVQRQPWTPIWESVSSLLRLRAVRRNTGPAVNLSAPSVVQPIYALHVLYTDSSFNGYAHSCSLIQWLKLCLGTCKRLLRGKSSILSVAARSHDLWPRDELAGISGNAVSTASLAGLLESSCYAVGTPLF